MKKSQSFRTSPGPPGLPPAQDQPGFPSLPVQPARPDVILKKNLSMSGLGVEASHQKFRSSIENWSWANEGLKKSIGSLAERPVQGQSSESLKVKLLPSAQLLHHLYPGHATMVTSPLQTISSLLEEPDMLEQRSVRGEEPGSTWEMHGGRVEEPGSTWEMQGGRTEEPQSTWEMHGGRVVEPKSTWEMHSGVVEELGITWEMHDERVKEPESISEMYGGRVEEPRSNVEMRGGMIEGLGSTWEMHAVRVKEPVSFLVHGGKGEVAWEESGASHLLDPQSPGDKELGAGSETLEGMVPEDAPEVGPPETEVHLPAPIVMDEEERLPRPRSSFLEPLTDTVEDTELSIEDPVKADTEDVDEAGVKKIENKLSTPEGFDIEVLGSDQDLSIDSVFHTNNKEHQHDDKREHTDEEVDDMKEVVEEKEFTQAVKNVEVEDIELDEDLGAPLVTEEVTSTPEEMEVTTTTSTCAATATEVEDGDRDCSTGEKNSKVQGYGKKSMNQKTTECISDNLKSVIPKTVSEVTKTDSHEVKTVTEDATVDNANVVRRPGLSPKPVPAPRHFFLPPPSEAPGGGGELKSMWARRSRSASAVTAETEAPPEEEKENEPVKEVIINVKERAKSFSGIQNLAFVSPQPFRPSSIAHEIRMTKPVNIPPKPKLAAKPVPAPRQFRSTGELVGREGRGHALTLSGSSIMVSPPSV